MELENIKDWVKVKLPKLFSVEISAIREDARFYEDMGMDSLEVIELIIAVEKKFQIKIPDEVAEKLARLDSFCMGVLEIILFGKVSEEFLSTVKGESMRIFQ